MRILTLLLTTMVLSGTYMPHREATESPCASDTLAVRSRRAAVAHSLSYEDYTTLGLPYQPSESSIMVVTDSATCSAGLAALNALGGEPDQAVLILGLAGSGWAIVGTALLDDTLHFFTKDWQYLFTLHGGG